MALMVRKGSDAVVRALVLQHNALRAALAESGRFVHRDTTGHTSGDFLVPVAVPARFLAPAAVDLQSLLRLAAEIAQKHALHLRDAFAHRAMDGANGLTRPPPDTLVTAVAFVNEAKAKWNAHLVAPELHTAPDPQPITAPDATDLQTALDLANTYRAVYATHIQNALPGAFLQLIEP
jgi:hypothetical protein